jgi:hypothetical protein
MSDGVVPYWSSHLDTAESELIIPSGHDAHQNPQAIARWSAFSRCTPLIRGSKGGAGHLPCQSSAQVVCRSHKLSATRTSRLPAAQNARTAAQVVGHAHRLPGRPHRLSGLSHSLTDERTSGRTRAQRAGTRPQVVCHAHRFPDTRTGCLTTRTSSRTAAQVSCHAL